MRLVTYRHDRGERPGLLEDSSVIDLIDALGLEGTSSMHDLLDDWETVEPRLESARSGDALPLDEVRLCPPVTNPEKIVCIGLNYADHAAEAGIEPPEVPTFFAKFANALLPDGSDVRLPAASRKVDFEAEVAFVVGRTASEIEPEEALDHIAGYMLFNDLSARDLQFQTPQWLPGKIFDGSAPCGPALVTADEIRDPGRIGIALDLNGERMQDSSTAQLIFSIPELLSHLSKLMTMKPGDIVSTGTPAGVGSTRVPRVWLAPGDEVVVSSPELGVLTNRMA